MSTIPSTSRSETPPTPWRRVSIDVSGLVVALVLALAFSLVASGRARAAPQDEDSEVPLQQVEELPADSETPPVDLEEFVVDEPPVRDDLPAEVEAEASPLLPGRDAAAPAAEVESERGERSAAPPRIRAIEIRSDSALEEGLLEEMRSILGFDVGDPLTDSAVARALRNIQASGLSSLAYVYSRPAADGAGVVAEVVLRANVLVDIVEIEGDTGEVDEDDLLDDVPQGVGQPLIESRLVRGVYEMQDELRAAGYYEASVRLAPRIDETNRRAVVVYRVEAGPRARVATIRFTGDQGPYSVEQLREPLRSKIGEPYRQGMARRDAERLETWLIGQGYRTARVDRPSDEYLSESQEVLLSFEVAVGPKVEIDVRGAELKKLKKNDLLPFLGDEGFDEALLLLAENRLRNWYQEQGHYNVEVDVHEERAGGVLTIVVVIDPGPVYTLEEVAFEGNEAYSDDRLRDLVATRETSFFTRLPLIGGGGRLVDETLSEDLSNLEAFYALEGHVDAEIGPAEVEGDDLAAEEGEGAEAAAEAEEVAGGDGPRELRVTIPIVEGPQQKVVGLSLAGVEAFDPEEVEDDLVIDNGGPFHPRILDASLDQIRSRYERQGYDAVNVSATTAWNPDHTRVDVSIRVLEGPQTVVDRVIVRGNQHTEPEVIRRAVGLDPGEPVSRSRLLEAERSLYRLGIFSRVELQLTPAPLGATTRDVVVRVEEGEVRSVRYGVSLEYNDRTTDLSYGGSLGFTHQNLLGRGITLAADARVLYPSESRYRLFVEQPTVGDLDVPVTYTLFSTTEQRAGFEVDRRGARVEARRQMGLHTQVGLAYDYRIVENRELDDVDPADGEDLERRDQTLRVAGFIPTLIHDHRNDPFNPSDGYTSLAQIQYAFPLLAAEADFLKLFLQHSQYFDLDFAVLAASVRVGGIEPLDALPGDIVDPIIPGGVDLPSEEIFLAERFFAGGGSSHRGYRPDELGIPFSSCLPDGFEDFDLSGDQPLPPVSDDCAATLFRDGGGIASAGGNGLALLNLDVRFPLFGPVEGVIFFDFGNVWADWRQIDPSDFRSGSGVELRYVSPVGPLRLGVGFPLDPYPGAEEYVIYVNLGAPF